MKPRFFLSLFLVLFFPSACQKEKAINIDPNFAGTWRFVEHLDKTHYISINEDSRGEYRVYNSSKEPIKWSSDQQRKWLIKKDVLHFGWSSIKHQRFNIDQYPQKATQPIIIPYDTIDADQYYIILNGNYFTLFK